MTSVVASVMKLIPSNSLVEDTDEKSYYWNILLKYWKLPSTFKHFPGPNPVSMERKDFKSIADDDYLIALKTDGVRYLLLMTTKPSSTEAISLMIDRALNMYEVEIWANEEYFYHGCLLDGELVWTNNNTCLQFIIFDVVMLKGQSCIEMSYRERMHVIHTNVLCMDEQLEDDSVEQMISEEDKFCARNNLHNLKILPKMCVPKQRIDELWNNNQRLSSHKNDGLIFTLNNFHVHTGTSSAIFKWKPSHSVDVRCYFNPSSHSWSLYANDNYSDNEICIDKQIGNHSVIFQTNSKLLEMLERKLDCVIECVVKVEGSSIVLTAERERTDKKTANTMKTMNATILNVCENIKIEDLFEISYPNNTIVTDIMEQD